jgi:carboxypeptidase Taq
MEEKMERLKGLLRRAADIQGATAVLGWDQSTYMPKGGAPARGRQTAVLSELGHEAATDPEIGRLLDELEGYGESLAYESDDAALLRAARRKYEQMVKVPASFAAKMSEHASRSYQIWTEARGKNDWQAVEPELERTLELSRELANYFPGYEHIADPLIDMADYGMRATEVRRIFGELREGLTPLIREIGEAEQVDDGVLRLHYPKEGQLKFSEEVIRDFGYDFERGRLDLTHHPFCTMFSIGDVRITTRVNERDLGDCMFSVMHEAGHAMHVMGADAAFEGTPLSGFVSAGLAESQSRLWENLVGRSRSFWEHYFPKLQGHFPEQLGKVEVEDFYRAINKVQPSLIRTDADEVTYNLHPLLRFDLELALLEGSLGVRDLPEAWNERYRSDLGVTPPDYKDGVMQDVHWYFSTIGGMFQGYTLGNILAGMFFKKAEEELGDVQGQLRRGEFGELHGWLKEKIYQHGAKFTTNEVVERVTGGGLRVEPLVGYLRGKYGEIYGLE